MAESHVVSGLITKRSEFAGLLDHHQKEIERITADLRHLDATIKIFSPEFDLRSVRPTRHLKRNNHFRHGEIPCMVLDAMRITKIPLTSRAIAEDIIQKLGQSLTTEHIETVQKSVCTVLKNLQTKQVVKLTGDKIGTARAWTLV